MKKYFFFAMMSAIALSGTLGLTACSSEDDIAAVEENPTYDPVEKTVTTQFVLNVNPAGQGTTPVPSPWFHRTANVPMPHAAGKKGSTDATGATCWKPAKKVSIPPPMTGRTRQRRRPCISGSMERRLF